VIESLTSKQNQSPLISVVTVVYNREHEIEETIQSVLHQTFQDLEYVVIDGASKDRTPEIIRQYGDQIDTWISEPDKGIYDAMNKGLSYAKGKWVYFLNSGDVFYDPKVLEQIAASLTKTSYEVVAGKVLTTGEGGGAFFPLRERMTDHSARTLFSSAFCHQAMFVRRQAYLAAGGFNREFKTFADFDVIHRIIQQSNGFEKTEILIARYDLSGVSNNWRYAMRHFTESEKLFEAHGEGSGAVAYALRWLKARFFYFRKWSLNALKGS
jgi:glycosyltransferase involved in cell wall biosynthesis